MTRTTTSTTVVITAPKRGPRESMVMSMLQTQVGPQRVLRLPAGRPLTSGDEGHGATTHGGRDPAKVDSPPLRKHLGCSGRHVLDAIHWGDRCHHQADRRLVSEQGISRHGAYQHAAYCRLI